MLEDKRRGLVAYFYFTNLQIEYRAGEAAWRAILTQILQSCQSDPNLIDIAPALHDNGHGQIWASEEEVSAILLLLEHLGPSYLVFDGLDECSDPGESLDSTAKITGASSQCQVILLTQPNVHVSSIIGYTDVCQISLEPGDNYRDIEAYLRLRISKLMQQSAFAGPIDLDDIVGRLSQRSNSMFLWTVLMCSYLSSPYLTPRERLNAINELNRFEGLDVMYTRILEELAKRAPKEHRHKTQNIFNWLSVTRERLTTKALRNALAVQKSRQATEHDYIRDFEAILPQMCGSLVEIRCDQTVDFIHLSVLEFLRQPANVSESVIGWP